MPTKKNYIFYKLCCDDYDDIYIGSTINFRNRKYEHKSSVNNPNAKNYNCYKAQFIRENGGWDNWNMLVLKKYPCNNKEEARLEERRFFEELNSNLNTRRPFRTEDEKKDYDKEQKQKHKIKRYEKASQKIECECGSIIRRSDISTHKKSQKHQKYINSLSLELSDKEIKKINFNFFNYKKLCRLF